MGAFLIILLIIAIIIAVVCIVYYISTLPQRQKNAEIYRREELLCQQRIEAEIANQNARIAGQIARYNINIIANSGK